MAARCRSALRQFMCLSEFGVYENETSVTSSPASCYDVCQFTLDACDAYADLIDAAFFPGATATFLGLPSNCAGAPTTNCIPSEHYALIDPSFVPTSPWNSGPYETSGLYMYQSSFSPNDISLCPAPSHFGVNNGVFIFNHITV